MLGNDPDALNYFFRIYANSVEGRRDETMYTTDPTNGFEIDMVSQTSKVVDKFLAYFESVGFGMDVEYTDEDEDYEDEIIYDVPDKYPTYLMSAEYN